MKFSEHEKETIKEFVSWLYDKYEIFEPEEDACTLYSDMKYHNLDEVLKEYFDEKEIAEIKHADSSDIFERLNEIDDELKDFFISGHKCDLLYAEQYKLKTELLERGYSVK